MLYDLVRAMVASVPLAVLPGWFWARSLLRSADDGVERLAFSVALSITLVPALSYGVISLLGGGVTLAVALVCAFGVFVSGLGVYLLFGPGKGREASLGRFATAPGPFTLGLLALGLLPPLALNLGLAGGYFEPLLWGAGGLLFVGAGVACAVESRRATPVSEVSVSGVPDFDAEEGWGGAALRWLGLAAVLAVTLARAYLGPVRYDWPFLRGIDQFTQAIMSNLMLSTGSTADYMVYPPGFHLLIASVSRLSGLEPMQLFPVMGPALLVFPPLALYALANRLWGWRCGLLAAFVSGVVLGSSYQYLSEARYPQLLAAEFLSVLTLAALLRLYSSPSRRSVVLLALVGSSVPLYHHVGAYFLALILGLVAITVLPYLLIRDRERGLALLGSFALLGALAVIYSWKTYDLGSTVLGLFSGSAGGATDAAITGVIGTQRPYVLDHVLGAVSFPVVALGLAGLALVIFSPWRRAGSGYALARFTLLLWCVVMFAGSRTALSGFPERFELDLGVPLALLAAYVIFCALRVLGGRASLVVPALGLSVVGLFFVGSGAVLNIERDGGPAPSGPAITARVAMTPDIQRAGEWLRENNTGGNIIATPYLATVPSRAMLALGDYSAVQTFVPGRIELNRDLPPSGQGPPIDALRVFAFPATPEAQRIIEEYDIRYIVLYKGYPGIKWWLFEQRTDLYTTSFENQHVLIVAPRTTAS